jgi:hypothetical protein
LILLKFAARAIDFGLGGWQHGVNYCFQSISFGKKSHSVALANYA